MTPNARPAHRVLIVAAVSSVLVLPALVPAAASADYRQANTWSGGSVVSQPGLRSQSIYPRSGALVSLVTGAPKARMKVSVYDARCAVSVAISGGRSEIAPGGQGLYEALTVSGRKTRRYDSRYGTSKLRVTVDLAPSSPGVLAGTVKVDGPVRSTRKTYTCRMTTPVVVRSHQVLSAPLARGSTDPSLPRTGLVETTLSPRVPGSIAISRRTDGRLQALWTFRRICRTSRAKRFVGEFYESSKRFPINEDGTFRGVERIVSRGRFRGRAYVYRISAAISGRIGTDGIARGRVTNTATTVYSGGRYPTERCSDGDRSFVAAP